MATKLGKSEKAKTTSAPASAGADDLEVLEPNAALPVGDRKVVVREYGFVEGLRVRAFMRPFTSDLVALFESGSDVLTEDVMDLIAQHLVLVRQAMAQSIADPGEDYRQEDITWINSLSDADGDILANTWWGVNGLFFVRQAVRRTAEKARRKALAGATSTPPSPTQDSVSHPNSVDTRNGNLNSSTSV